MQHELKDKKKSKKNKEGYGQHVRKSDDDTKKRKAGGKVKDGGDCSKKPKTIKKTDKPCGDEEAAKEVKKDRPVVKKFNKHVVVPYWSRGIKAPVALKRKSDNKQIWSMSRFVFEKNLEVAHEVATCL